MDPLAVVGNCMDPVRFRGIPQLGHGTHWFSDTVGVVGVGLFDGNRHFFVVDMVAGVVVGAWYLVGNRGLEGILQFDVEVLVEADNMGVGVVVVVEVGVGCKYIRHAVVEVVEGIAVGAVVDFHNPLEMANIHQFSVVEVVGVVASVGMGMVVGIVDMGVGVLVGEDSCFLVVGVLGLVVVDDDCGNVHDGERRLPHGHAPRRSVGVSIYRFEFLV